MQNTKNYIQTQLDQYEKEYWRLEDKLIDKKQELLLLTNEVKNLTNEHERLDGLRKEFENMLNEINQQNNE